ncbi:hypothetical protein [Leptospira alexanderi]|uniref:Uncharacterized protein n=1 Tax=Leptospira alexanderi serovar Manhao 3 str. L 60 TaxID=1049759 RepID=V6HW52_9LEPT|nr:hypothetical protein [Leptospira alexanderi]EQA62095.1 hypothetical protein LEP1GSC062_2187 [Leptospira alexanderi serovar Manhao 3 str. L 60]
MRIGSDSEISFRSEIPKTVLNSEPVYRIYWNIRIIQILVSRDGYKEFILDRPGR